VLLRVGVERLLIVRLVFSSALIVYKIAKVVVMGLVVMSVIMDFIFSLVDCVVVAVLQAIFRIIVLLLVVFHVLLIVNSARMIVSVLIASHRII